MNTQDYTKYALRTESVPDTISYNKETISTLLQIMVHVSEILDAIKKSVYYKRDIDLQGIFAQHMKQIQILSLQDTNNDASLTVEDDNTHIRNFHGLLGVLTESGELASMFKKYLNNDVDITNLKEELGDINWYEAILCDTNNFTFDQVLERNIEKLALRYKDKYSDHAANNRDVEAEREILSK